MDGKGSKMDPKYFRANLIRDGHMTMINVKEK